MEKLLCEWLKSEASKKGMQIDTPEINQSEKQAINSIIEKYDLKSKSRRRTLIYPRFYFVHFLVKIMNKEPFEVAYMLGKDRTSMLYAAKEAQRYISDNDSYFLKMVEGIKNDLSKIQPKKVALVSDLKVLKRVTGKSKNKRTQISLCSEKKQRKSCFCN